MTTQLPKKGQTYTFDVSLIDQSNTKLLKATPTLAAGDVKLYVDNVLIGNLATLPTVTPAGSKIVKVIVDGTTEMTGDKVSIVFSDVAGAEWCDLMVSFATPTRNGDDYGFPLTPGRGTLIDTSGRVDAGAINGISASAVSAITANIGTTQPINFTGTAGSALVKTDMIDIAGAIVDPTVAQLGVDARKHAGTVQTTGADLGALVGLAGTLTVGERNSVADALLDRDLGAGTDTAGRRSPRNAMRPLVNKVDVALGIVYKENDATTAWTFTKTTDGAALPITGVDPA